MFGRFVTSSVLRSPSCVLTFPVISSHVGTNLNGIVWTGRASMTTYIVTRVEQLHHQNKSPSWHRSTLGCSPYQSGLSGQGVSCLLSVPRRSFFGPSKNETSEFCGPKMRERLRKRDGMPKSYELIYRSDFGWYVFFAQTAVFFGLTVLLTALVYYIVSGFTAEEIEAFKEAEIQAIKDDRQRERETYPLKAFVDRRPKETTFYVYPGLEDTVDVDPIEVAVLGAGFLFFAIALWKLQRVTPVRIYAHNKQKNWRVAIMYGHLFPGRLTHLEFVAGGVKVDQKFYNMHAGVLHREASGRYLIFYPRFFRQPSDYNKILGYDEKFMDAELKSRLRQEEEETEG